MDAKLKNLMTGSEMVILGKLFALNICKKINLRACRHEYDDVGNYRPRWTVLRKWRVCHMTLRLLALRQQPLTFSDSWESKSSQELDFEVFNQGGYVEAVRESNGGKYFKSSLP